MIVLDVSLTKPGFAAGCFNISVLSLKSNKSVENATTQSTTHNNFTKDSNQENNENDLKQTEVWLLIFAYFCSDFGPDSVLEDAIQAFTSRYDCPGRQFGL